jgi:hypothetical protein
MVTLTLEEQQQSTDDLKSLPMSELLARLGVDPDGVSQAEAEKRLGQYGPNEIAEKKTNAFSKFLRRRHDSEFKAHKAERAGRINRLPDGGAGGVSADLLRERVRSGIAAARKRGVVFGRRPGQRIKADRLRPQNAKACRRRPIVPGNKPPARVAQEYGLRYRQARSRHSYKPGPLNPYCALNSVSCLLLL